MGVCGQGLNQGNVVIVALGHHRVLHPPRSCTHKSFYFTLGSAMSGSAVVPGVTITRSREQACAVVLTVARSRSLNACLGYVHARLTR